MPDARPVPVSLFGLQAFLRTSRDVMYGSVAEIGVLLLVKASHVLRQYIHGCDDETRQAAPGPKRMGVVPQHAVRIAADSVALEADLRVPRNASGIVLFAHRSGSSRFSPRNGQVAPFLNRHRLATLLLDLLTAEEESLGPVSEIRFDIGLLARRLTAASEWVAQQSATRALPQGYFGASTTAAALIGAATRAQHIRAVVSRGGRADLAGDALPAVRAATLLIVGGEDPDVLALNRLALSTMRCEHELIVVPGATRLFGEPGALEEVARLARAWFLRYLVPAPQPA